MTQLLGDAAYPRLVLPASWGNAYSVGFWINAESLGEMLLSLAGVAGGRCQKTVSK